MLKISSVTNPTNEEWDRLWICSESATYFHSREWAEIWQSFTNGTMYPFPQKLTFSDGKVVILPVMSQNYYRGFIKRYALTGPPFISKYGNWLNNDSLTGIHITLLTSFILKKFTNVTWQLNPFDDRSKDVIVNSYYVKRIPHTTYMIDLTKGEDYIYSRIKSSCKNHIKQGINNKLIFSEGTDITHWKIYYNIYLDTINRWGPKTPYVLDWKLFEILFNTNNPIIKLWLVWYENIAIAGSINFYSHGKIIGWHMASLTEYRKLRPNHFLEYAMIKDGIRRNYCWYDLGTDGGNKGLEEFKRSFGPEKIMCDKIYAWHPIIHYVKNTLGYFHND
jgi:hypothetical protein